jgi:hypothetical protein
MIIKLASIIPSDDYEQTLNTREKAKWKAMKAGAILSGGLLGSINFMKTNNELKPSVGRVKRFLHESGIRKAKLKDMIPVTRLTVGRGIQMGAAGALAGALAGYGLHEGARKLYQKKHHTQQ